MCDIEFAEKEADLKELFYEHKKLLTKLMELIIKDNNERYLELLILEVALDSCNKYYITTSSNTFKVYLKCCKNLFMNIKDDPHIQFGLEENQYYELLILGSKIEEIYFDDSWMYNY